MASTPPKSKQKKKNTSKGLKAGIEGNSKPLEHVDPPPKAWVDITNIFYNASVKRKGAFDKFSIHVDTCCKKVKKIMGEVKAAMARTVYQETLFHKLMLLNEELRKSYLINNEVQLIGANVIFLEFPFGKMDPLGEDSIIILPKETLDPNLHCSFPNLTLYLLLMEEI